MNPILPARLDWPSAIGNFILNYGSLDWHMLVFLEKRLPPDHFAKIRNEHFQERVTRVKKLIAARPLSTKRKQAFDQFFARLESIRELRNHIAHGHLLVRITKIDKTPTLTLSLPKDVDADDTPETRHLEFEELTRGQTELAMLIEDFQKLTDDWRTETIPIVGPDSRPNGTN
jgi:hypothetical protein